jgi:hypothetical protein
VTKETDDLIIQAHDVPTGRGGDLRLIPGMGCDQAPDGDVILQRSDGRPWLTVKPTGKVEFAEDFDAQQATRAFWSACGEHHPRVQRELFVAMAEAVDDLRQLFECSASYPAARNSGRLRRLDELIAKRPTYRMIAAEHRSWLERSDHQEKDCT